MIQGETIIMFAYNKWSEWRSPNEIALRLSRDNRIIFIEVFPHYELLRYQEGRWRYLRRFWPRKPLWISDTLVVLKPPPMLPLAVSLLSRSFRSEIAHTSIRMSKRFQAWQLRRQLSALGLQPSILFFFEPFELLLIGKFREQIACYRTYDEITHFFSNQEIADVIEEIEQKNIARTDLVFCSSNTQHQKRAHMNPQVYFVPNGADFSRFNQALSQADEKPIDFSELKGPLIGYIGVIDYRMDFDLLTEIAVQQPERNLVLMGPIRDYCREKVKKLDALPNVCFPGGKAARDVPGYLKWFDVAIIPFLVTHSTNTMYPYKLHEYLAMGKPVISTNLAELGSFDGLVRLGKSHGEFVRMIEEELKTDSKEKKQRRIEVARQNSWDIRVAEISRLLEDALASKRGR